MSNVEPIYSFLVGFNFSQGEKNGIMLVGTKDKNGNAKIINSEQGEHVIEIYKKLTGENK